MKIEYKITEYFEKNNLFDSDEAEGITIKNDDNLLTIEGKSRDLVELADLLANLAKDNSKGAHIHIDNSTLLNEESDVKEIIIEKK